MYTSKYSQDQIAALYDLDPDSFKEFVDRYDDVTDEEIEAWYEQHPINEQIVLKQYEFADEFGNAYFYSVVTFDSLKNDDACFEYKQHGYLPAQDRHPVEFYRCD